MLVALAAVAWSTAGLLQRELSVDTATQTAGRALFAAAGLLVYVVATQRGRALHALRASGAAGAGVVALLAISSASFFIALNHASVANVLFMQALAPILAAVLGTLLGDPVARRTWLAMGIAVAGVGVMVGGPGHPSAAGLALSLVMTTSFAGIVVITRHRRDVSMAPATVLSQVVVLVLAAPFAHPGALGGRDVLLLATLGVCQIGLGFMFLTAGARLIPAGEVALITLLEIVLGPLWVWAILSERPSTATLIGGAVVLAAVALDARGGRPQWRRVPFVWPAQRPLPDSGATAQLGWRPLDVERDLGLVARALAASPNVWDRRAVATLGADGAAARILRTADGVVHADDWWEVATVEGADAGFVLPTRFADDGVGTIWHVGVLPAARGRGVGRALLRRGAARLLAEGVERIHCDADAVNAAMLHLFDTEGWDRGEAYEQRFVL